ncbi:54S ribosomal protein L24 [Colletotrichum orbiculare MAFF 240422]|uniref:54S ribosomal protein L24 n=1 Tax=Colletotrichum orbiculare (strain 104-T / ATCC 96160 / CBS 514.97 / LARS 414 / MAFF 240422) TaxID=1213857 RepID=N4UY80_COLOR|nr:54S ribosomal protein L24 [Colletotrichum orbiculare MAFF 240422]
MPPSLRPLTAALSSLTLTSARSTTISSSARLFSTSIAQRSKTISPESLPAELIPPYPLGPRLIYKQSNKGLYGLARPRSGNVVSPKHKQVSLRTWRPNVFRKRLYSVALRAWIRCRITMRVLRTVRKEGGLDQYVTKTKARRIKELGPGGWKIRWLVLQTLPYRVRYLRTLRDLGVNEREPAEDNTRIVPVILDVATSGHIAKKNQERWSRYFALLESDERERLMAFSRLKFNLGEDAEDGNLIDEDYEDVHIEGVDEDVPTLGTDEDFFSEKR